MAALREIAREYGDEIRDGIAWVIVWKTGRSWNATAVWLTCKEDKFEDDDLEELRAVLKQDQNAVMLNGYYCGHLDEDMNAEEIATGILWHYENNFNTLEDSTAWPDEDKQGGDHMSKFYTCPYCGCNLDHGEPCDCQKLKEAAQEAGQSAGTPATPDSSKERSKPALDPVLMPGA